MATPKLTRREREVADLVAQGLTNREIAARLFISERTAESHVEQIRGKLGFRSRTQVAGWVAANYPEHEAAPVAARPPRRPRRRGAGIVLTVAALVALVGLAGALIVRFGPRAPGASAAPTVTTVAGTGQRAFSGDGGEAAKAPLVRPLALALAPDGSLYVAEGNRVRQVRPDGRIATLAGRGDAGRGGDGGPAPLAQLNTPQGIAVDSAGNVYIADTLNNRVRRVGADGLIRTVAGTGEAGYSGDGLPGVEAKLNLPTGLAIGFNDSLLVADTGNNVVRQVDQQGVIRTLVGTGEAGYRGDGGPALYALLHAPGGLAFDDVGRLYVADTLNQRIRSVDVNGQISTVAGTGVVGFGGDGGPGVYATLHLASNPLEGMGQALAVGPRGDLLIADGLNGGVRRLDVNGVIRTVVRLRTPLAVAVDPRGGIYFADADDNRVGRIG